MKNAGLKKYSKRSLFTRQCIGEALIVLLDEVPYDQITISMICKKAGISRMTFYHYFCTKNDIMNNYIYEIFASFQCHISYPITMEIIRDYKHILQAILFFGQYASFVLTLRRSGQYCLLLDNVNRYFEEVVVPSYSGPLYDLYFYSGALLNAFVMWEESGKKETPEELAAIMCRLMKST